MNEWTAGVAKVAVTGAAGFLGRHLLGALAHQGHEVYGLDLTSAVGGPESGWIQLPRGSDLGAATETLAASRGLDLLVHCAFVNRKPDSQTNDRYLQHALACDGPLLEACAKFDVSVLLVSSSAVYGSFQAARGIQEDDPINPVSLYGVAKVTQEMLARFYAVSSGLRLSIARLFNLCGPGQAEGMLIPDWVSRVSAIARGAAPRLIVRNRATTRDFVDVRDAARALAVMATSFSAGELVNVASGKAVSLTDLSDELQRLCPVPYEVIETDPVPAGTDPLMHYGSPERVRHRYGWAAEIAWQDSLADVWQEHQGRR
jgi:UDP-glucose 4-epimerase